MSLLDPPTNPELATVPRHSRADSTHQRRLLLAVRDALPGWVWLAMALVVCAVVATALILRDAAESPRNGAPVVVSTPTAAPATPDLPEGSFAGDGGPGDVQVYVVGEHIRPGVYATAGALDPKVAPHWKISRFGSAGDVPRRYRGGEPVGPVTVTLEIGDIFETKGYRPWAPAPEDGNR